MGKFATGCYGLGSWVERSIQDTQAWLDYTYRCVLIRVSPLLSETRKLIPNNTSNELRDGERQTRVITHLPRSMARYIHYPLVRFHKMKYSIFIGAIPLVVAGLSSIACCHADTIVPVKVQSMTITRANSPETFIERWLPLAEMPKRIRTIAIKAASKEEIVDTARPVVAPDDPVDIKVAQVEHTTLPRSRPRSIRYMYKRDQRTCVRHGMKTVYYGKHRWRCRRG